MQSAIFGLDLLLSKPLKSSSFILNLNGSAEARTEFSIESSITYLLITTGGLFHLRLIDPHGNEAEFEIIQTYYTGRAYLVKFPTAGTWTLDLSDCMFESVNIIGYSGVEATGSCVDPVCGINATCEEFGGYHLDCTCELGFAGAGSYCYDIDECSDYNIHHCDYGYCINTLGSYICQCYSGFTYKNKEEGCVDIDECASETHNCHHFASCTNYVGGFSCTCFPGYIGDGHYCEVNECEQGSPCGITEECIKHIGSYTCLDPCHNNTMLEDHWRSTANTYGSQWFSSWGWYHCDNELLGWYRFKGHTDLQMPEYCVPPNSCGTYAPMWLNGPHPTLEEGIVYRTACASYYWYGCCTWSSTLSVKACPDGYYVYKIDRTPMCDSAYCVESNVTCLDINCAPDEYCVTQDGVPECRCIDTTSMRGMDQHSIAAYLSPQVECQISEIRVTFGRCLLERLGYNTSMIRLRDRQCTAFVERANLSYSVSAISVPPRDGYCGGEISGNETEDMIIYRNTIYLIPNYDGIIERDPYPINFYCAFPVDMEVSLLTAVNPFISSAALTVGGTAQLTVRMGLFQTLEYTNLYEGDEVWLDMTSMMYVGVLVEKAKETMQIVLVMKNCFATPTPDKSNPVKYYIIKDSCANRNDPTISVFENGQSLRGRFSLQVFKFIGNFDKVYLHCEVRLCDTAYQNCMPWCGMRSASQDEGSATQTLSIGPLHNRDFKESTSAVPSTSKPPGSNARGISASLEVLVIMLLIAFILLK
ncbi:uromodulin-like [Hyperolius riggenbachi]|uniref:uromodulin-like n=1 Tax=Hyperolius riggenbachi TaxID=752182 RepID=UPI0035A27424